MVNVVNRHCWPVPSVLLILGCCLGPHQGTAGSLILLISVEWLDRGGCLGASSVCAQPCLTLCDPMDCSLPGSSCPWDSLGKNTGAGSHSLPQGIFPTQGSNPGLLYCKWILYYLSYQESPVNNVVIVSDEQRSLSHSYACIHSPPNSPPTQAAT